VIKDPLWADGEIDLADVLIIIGKVIVTFAFLMITVVIFIWFMRKVIGDMQNRVGPNRAGPFGILQSLADGVKLFMKEQSIPDQADARIFKLAPYLTVLPAFLAFCVVPWGTQITIAGNTTNLQVAEIPMGVLWVLAMSGMGVYGVMLAGWASGSKYPLLGGIRASAQVISYEAALGLSVIGAVIRSGSLSMQSFVAVQAWDGVGSLRDWLIASAPLSFFIFVIAALAETNQPPFDLVEAEQELVGGFHTEYTGIRFAIFNVAEFMNLVTMSGVAITLFLGGPNGPGVDRADNWGALISFGWFVGKLWVFLFAAVWLRASVPRMRYDQLMDLGWRVLIPLSLLWTGIVAVIKVGRGEDWSPAIYLPAAFAGAGLVALFIYACLPKREIVPSPSRQPREPGEPAEPGEHAKEMAHR
jgi:NADH-quinone oxidoreductase subunit H